MTVGITPVIVPASQGELQFESPPGAGDHAIQGPGSAGRVHLSLDVEFDRRPGITSSVPGGSFPQGLVTVTEPPSPEVEVNVTDPRDFGMPLSVQVLSVHVAVSPE